MFFFNVKRTCLRLIISSLINKLFANKLLIIFKLPSLITHRNISVHLGMNVFDEAVKINFIKSHPLTTLPLNVLHLHHGKKGGGPQGETHTKNPNLPSTEKPRCVFGGLSGLTDFSSPHPLK